MTGIERLRELAGTLRENIGDMWLNDSSGPLWLTIINIADQIVRETIPREPGDGDVCPETLHAMALAQLDDWERAAIAWVREHGGLSNVKDICHDFCAVVERLGIEWSESELHGLMDVLDRRLMPEGMEWLVEAWPRFEDDAPARFGEEAIGFACKPPFVIDHVTLFDGGEATVCAEADLDSGKVENFFRVHPGERVKRPAKVLDADGAEIRVGDTVWGLQSSRAYVVDGFVTDGSHGEYTVDAHYVIGLEQVYLMPSQLTHRAPVFAADGRPLREGETVWFTDNGENRLTVTKIVTLKKGASVYARDETDDDEYVGVSPSQLTHERPVNHCFECSHWQAEPGRDRLGVCWDTYGERECEDSYAAVLGTSEACAQFERRAKALAGDA